MNRPKISARVLHAENPQRHFCARRRCVVHLRVRHARRTTTQSWTVAIMRLTSRVTFNAARSVPARAAQETTGPSNNPSTCSAASLSPPLPLSPSPGMSNSLIIRLPDVRENLARQRDAMHAQTTRRRREGVSGQRPTAYRVGGDWWASVRETLQW